MLIPLQINPQLGVACIFEIMNHFLRKNPARMLKTPIVTIVTIVLPDSLFEYFFSISVVSIPEMTINGTFPSIMTPKIDLTGFRKFRSSSFERILRARKKSNATTVLSILLRTAR